MDELEKDITKWLTDVGNWLSKLKTSNDTEEQD